MRGAARPIQSNDCPKKGMDKSPQRSIQIALRVLEETERVTATTRQAAQMHWLQRSCLKTARALALT